MFYRFRVLIPLLAISVTLFSATLSVAQTTQHPNRITQELNGNTVSSVKIAGGVHPQTRQATDQGAVNGDRKMESLTLHIGLSTAQQKDLDALVAAQQNRSSAFYHKWLTQAEYGARFGLTDADLKKVTAWLAGQGFTVKSVAPSRNLITFSGKVAQVESAFRTQIHQFQLEGVTHIGNATEVAVPAGLSGVIMHVGGLSSFRPKARAVIRQMTPDFTSKTSGNHFLTPADWATIYNVNQGIYQAGFTGTGMHVAIVGQTFFPKSDIDKFRAAAGLSATKLNMVCISPAVNCNGTLADESVGDIGEADLDVEWAGGIAKEATVDYIYASAADANQNVSDALDFAITTYKVGAAVVPVISMSYGNCESDLVGFTAFKAAQDNILLQAVSQGQTVLNSSGDAGAAGCDQNLTTSTLGAIADWPASNPNVTAVGGTTFSGDGTDTFGDAFWSGSAAADTISSALQYIPETTWNDTAADQAVDPTNTLASGGGGVSTLYPLPVWQSAPSGFTGTVNRFVPDVSFAASADHDGYLVCTQLFPAGATLPSQSTGSSCVTGFRLANGNLAVFGGTSAGSPSFGGMLTLLVQKYGNFGNVNPTLYSLASHPATYAAVFHDVKTGDNKQPCTAGAGCAGGLVGFSAATGFDMATGLGSVNGGALFSAIGATASASAPSVVSVTPSAGAGLSQLFQLTYSDPAGFAAITSTQTIINSTRAYAGSCAASYTASTQTLAIINDNGAGWGVAAKLGVPGVLQNSQCSIDVGASSAAGVGNNLTLNLAVTFKPIFTGAKGTYTNATNRFALSSGWQTVGAWSVPASAPSAVSVTPSAGSGLSQRFQLTYSDPAGFAAITSTQTIINSTRAYAGSCAASYTASTQTLAIINDNGAGWGVATKLGVPGVLQNSQCSIDVGTSSAAGVGNNLTLNLAVTFKPIFTGAKSTYTNATNRFALSSGWQTKGTWSVPASAPSVVSVTPSAGSGLSQLFQLTYSDPAGFAAITSTQTIINSTRAYAGSCAASYATSTQTLAIINDNGAGWGVATKLGVPGVLQNSQCSIDVGASSATGVGNNLTLNLAVTFKPIFTGAKSTYTNATNRFALSSGWQTVGAWSVPASAPAAVSVTPSAGSGLSQLFQLTYSDPAGFAAITSTQTIINSTRAYAGSCAAMYTASTQTLAIINDNGAGWGVATKLGVPGVLQNSQCSIDVGASSAAGVGNNLTLNLAVTFKPIFAGAKSTYTNATNRFALSSGWQTKGTWSVPASAPSVVSVTPSAGSGLSQLFQLTYSDPAGFAAITSTQTIINSTRAYAGSCAAMYAASTQTLAIINDNGAGWGVAAKLGVPGVLQNSQCSIDVGASSVAGVGNNLTLNLAVTFKPIFAGSKSTYTNATNRFALSSGWQTKGTWGVPASAPAAVSVTPSAGSGLSQLFQLTYSDPAGFAAITSTQTIINSTRAYAGSCAAMYAASTQTLAIINDNGAGWGVAAKLGVPGVLQNSQCSIDVGASSAAGVGNNLTLNLAVTFKPIFTGAKDTYSNANNRFALNSGWQTIGAWRVPATGLVSAAPYNQPITTGAPNFGPTTGQTSRDWIDFGHLYRIRQTGAVSQIKVNVPVITGITGFYVSNCRTSTIADATPASTDMISTSNNLAGSLVAGVNTLTLSTPLNAVMGDYLCGRVEWSGGASVQNLYTAAAVSATGEAATLYFANNATPSAKGYDWTAQTALVGRVMLVEADMAPPLITCTGDSIASGAPLTYGFADTKSPLTAENSDYCTLVGQSMGVSTQNFGHTSWTANQIYGAMAVGALAVHPKYVALEGGVNDLLAGSSVATIEIQWTNILNAANAAGVVPIVIGVLPFSGNSVATLPQIRNRDTLNAWLVTAVPAAGGIYINPDPYLGMFDARGPAGNKWAMSPQYVGADGIHPILMGNQRVAQAILDGLLSTSAGLAAPIAPPATNFKPRDY